VRVCGGREKIEEHSSEDEKKILKRKLGGKN
jgi:hypothetical protein